jgi:hypothetical protein
MLLVIFRVVVHTVRYINCIINCNSVPYSYFPHVMSLHTLYIQLQTVRYTNYIIKCSTVLHSFSISFSTFPKHTISTLHSSAKRTAGRSVQQTNTTWGCTVKCTVADIPKLRSVEHQVLTEASPSAPQRDRKEK